MSFTNDEIKKFAHMIRLDINEDQLDTMNINQVFDWMNEMRAINTDGITPVFNSPAVELLDAPLRADTVVDSENNIRDKVLANAPDTVNGYFAVP
ncbi:MAG: Asp-tRNA(Asn)/Glu-tRNA(Gln) amidotransferase subunit GatC, partial [Alphaproteobacteria bacterium]|nr:Asp-tRNA(Asn)/Glu-tRNA(Gln) amidotransferase subunit GatC [Alphaproteobacteria bacterium]